MPNLLWLPYLGYADRLGLYNATRRVALSRRNPNFVEGHCEGGICNVKGLGSQHESHGLHHLPGKQCYHACIWHLGLVTQGLTATTAQEKVRVLKWILGSDAGSNVLHEGFDPDDPTTYNRDWFGWADSWFASWILDELDG